MTNPQDVLSFWLDEVGPDGWYAVDPELDAKIKARFMDLWIEAKSGGLGQWLTYPTGALAYLIVTDQFPRNMFRDEGTAFETDGLALAVAKTSIDLNWDQKIDEPARQFFFLPLMHSESLVDQERCVRLMLTRMPESGAMSIIHAQAHREVIRRFGRFPTRNAALQRPSTHNEASYIATGGYGSVLSELRAG